MEENEMQTKNQISLTRKALYAIMLLGVFLSAFGGESLPSVHAQPQNGRLKLHRFKQEWL
jgi:hypothetical protein